MAYDSDDTPRQQTPGKRIPTDELKAILAAERRDALAATQSSALSQERSDAMDYYNGDMSKDMPVPDGRSSAVSTDVADTIEGLMPSLMEIFTGSDEVVEFSPVGPEDVQAAQQETDYVNHVFMQENPGFLVLYSFIKDALLSKVGVVKVWWEETEDEERETFLDQSDDVLALLAQSPEIEIVEHTAHDDPNAPPPDPAQPDAPRPMLHDVTVVSKRKNQRACVEPVPPEEFGISRHARSLRDCSYCFHEVRRRQSDLIADGYDAEQIKALPTYSMATNSEENARDTVMEGQAATGDQSLNDANRMLTITEHYVRLDMERNGKVKLWRITTGGQDGVILIRDKEEDIVEEDMPRFAAMTPVIVTHRFFGKSIADLVMDIQRIKTALLRGMLDNQYLHNNPRVEVAEEFASEQTLDDLLVSRPGGIVRTKRAGGLQWQEVPDISSSIYPALQYFDATREWRTGVSRQGQGLDANALQNQSATAAAQLYSAAQARMKLIARIFAETGIRDLFSLLHGTIRKYGSQPQTVRLRNQWVSVDPRDWKKRNDMTIKVGLGTGGKGEQIAGVQVLIGAQEKAIAAGLVSKQNLYNAAKALTKLLGHKDVDEFFTAPDKPPDPMQPASAAIQPPPDPKMAEMQAKAQHDQAQAQIDARHQEMKAQAEAQREEQKFQLEMAQMREAHAIKMAEMKAHLATTLVTQAAKPAPGADGEQHKPQVDHAAIERVLSSLNPKQSGMRVVRDEHGRISHTEPVT